MSTNFLVSVLVPVYNVEQYVAEAIKSIQMQTYRNIEIIVIDDCSTDNTFEIVKDIAKYDSRVKFLRNDVNMNIVHSLNRALSMARGELILRCDGDDYISKGRLAKMVDFLLVNKEFSLVSTGVTKISPDGNIIGIKSFRGEPAHIKRVIKYQSPVLHIWLTYRYVYDKTGGYRNIPGAEDYDFILRILSLGYKITNLKDDFSYFVRLGRHGNTESMIGIKQYLMRWLCYRFYLQRIENKGIDDYSDGCCRDLKLSYIGEVLYSISNFFLKKAIGCQGIKRLLVLAITWPLIIISPTQIKKLYEFSAVKYLEWRYR